MGVSSFFMGKKVLVTGGGGLLGSHVVEELVKAGADVVVAQRSKPDLPQTRFKKADLLRMEDCLEATRGAEMVLHLAAEVAGLQYNLAHPATMFSRTSTMALNVLEAARAQGVERFLYMSSNCVYSPSAPIPYREEDGFWGEPDQSVIGYGWAKRLGELGARFYANEFGLKVAIVRPANLYGPRDKFDPEKSHVIPALIRRVFEAQDSLEVWGSGTQRRTFLYARDAARGALLALEKYAVADPVNITTDEEVTIAELANLIVRLSGKNLRLRLNPAGPEGQLRKSADSTKMRKVLGWTPEYTLEQGLRETIEWYGAAQREAAHRTR